MLFAGAGFASRVRVFDHPEGAGVQIFRSQVGRYSNLEGLSVWRDAGGHIRLTMVSDDNYLAVMRTQIVEVRVPTGVARAETKP